MSSTYKEGNTTYVQHEDSDLVAKVFRRTIGERQEWAYAILDPARGGPVVTDAPPHKTEQAAQDAARMMMDGMVPGKHDPV